MLREDLTDLLNRWVTDGRPEALDEVIDEVFDELRTIARSRLAGCPPGVTLQPTELVHEAYLRLRKAGAHGFEDRSRFFALAARLIRSILADHGRERSAVKRGGNLVLTELEGRHGPILELDLDRALALDEALKRLETRHPRQSRVVELRLFGGLTMPEIADAVGCSLPTVERDWSLGRRRMARELQGLG